MRIVLVFMAAIMLAGSTASAANPAPAAHCLTATRLTARVAADNQLTAHSVVTVHAGADITIAYTIDVYRRGVLEYHDATEIEAGSGPFNGDSVEQLPVSWRGERLRVRHHAASRCGSVTRWATTATPRRVRP